MAQRPVQADRLDEALASGLTQALDEKNLIYSLYWPIFGPLNMPK